MLLHDKDYVPPLKPAEVVTQDTPTARRSGSPWEGALALLNDSWEADLIDMWELFHLTNW